MTIQRKSAKQKGTRLEQRTAASLGGKRTPLSGAVGGGDASDRFRRYSIECKARAEYPALLRNAFAQAERDIGIGDTRVPLVVLGADRKESIYCLKESAFLELLDQGGTENAWHVKNRLRNAIKLMKEAIELAG